MIDGTYGQSISVCVEKAAANMVKRNIACEQMSRSLVWSNPEPLLDYFFWHLDHHFDSLIQLIWSELWPGASYFRNLRIYAAGRNHCPCPEWIQFVSLYLYCLALPL